MLSCLCSLDRAYFALWCREDNKDTESNVDWVPELLYSFLLLKGNLLLFSDLSPVETDHMLVVRVEQSVEEDVVWSRTGFSAVPFAPSPFFPVFQSTLFVPSTEGFKRWTEEESVR